MTGSHGLPVISIFVGLRIRDAFAVAGVHIAKPCVNVFLAELVNIRMTIDFNVVFRLDNVNTQYRLNISRRP